MFHHIRNCSSKASLNSVGITKETVVVIWHKKPNKMMTTAKTTKPMLLSTIGLVMMLSWSSKYYRNYYDHQFGSVLHVDSFCFPTKMMKGTVRRIAPKDSTLSSTFATKQASTTLHQELSSSSSTSSSQQAFNENESASMSVDENDNDYVTIPPSTKRSVILAAYDGPELESIQRYLRKQQHQKQKKQHDMEHVDSRNDCTTMQHTASCTTGILHIVTCTIQLSVDETTTELQQRIVGIAVPCYSTGADGEDDYLKQQYNTASATTDSSTKTIRLYKDSISRIPSKVSDRDAQITYIHSLSTIHCALPAGNVFSLNNNKDRTEASVTATKEVDATPSLLSPSSYPMTPTETPCKIVVLGGSEYATRTALGLVAANKNAIVYVVSQAKNAKLVTNSKQQQDRLIHYQPSVVHFSDTIQSYDTIVDCCGSIHIDDYSANNDLLQLQDNYLELLRSKHDCTTYVSTETYSQQLIRKNGLFSGPKGQKQYINELKPKLNSLTTVSNYNHNNNKDGTIQRLIPPPSLAGKTIEKVMDAGILFPTSLNDDTLSGSGSLYMRGWSLKDFWETTTWPKDSSSGGSTTIRYGFPILEPQLSSSSSEVRRWTTTSGSMDDDDDDVEIESKIARKRRRIVDILNDVPTNDDQDDEDVHEIDETDSAKEQISEQQRRRITKASRVIPPNDRSLPSSYDDEARFTRVVVQKVYGVEGLKKLIIGPQRTGLLFLSAPFCRTCRYLKPRYERMASEYYNDQQQRQPHNDSPTKDTSTNFNDDMKFIFWNAETIGPSGKELGRFLNVNAVPTFVLFQNGKVYGKPLAISKLPSTKLDAAMSSLAKEMSDQVWDGKTRTISGRSAGVAKQETKRTYDSYEEEFEYDDDDDSQQRTLL